MTTCLRSCDIGDTANRG